MTTRPGDVLLVDDDPDLLKLISLRLSSAGHRVRTADSGEAALASLAVARPGVVISDLRMPGIDGLQLFEAIHREHPALPVIILTAHGTIPDAVAATQRGVFGFLTKPFDSQELLQKVAAALRVAGDSSPESADMKGDWRAGIITRSPRMEDLLRQARLVADSDASVLIYGDSGTGKELLARAIHRASPRRDKAFVAVNCGAIPEPLLESELFGHARGAFSGAVQAHKGLFQAADGGTIFLDEIGDMPLALQVKLLRVLQERKIRRVGGTEEMAVDVRVIAATNRDLTSMVAENQFREDLYYRIRVIPIHIPPLRHRRDDIPILASHFLSRLNGVMGKNIRGLSDEALKKLEVYDWPGNIRELENAMERAYILETSGELSAQHLPDAVSAVSQFFKAGAIPEDGMDLEAYVSNLQKSYLEEALNRTGGVQVKAAELLRMSYRSFRHYMQKYGIEGK